MGLLVAVSATLVLADAEERSAKEKQIDKQLAAIEAVIPSEATLFGMATRLQTADVLLPKQPTLARQWIDNAIAALPAISHGPSADRFRVRITGLLARVDLAAAEEVARSTRRWETDDPAGDAWDQIVKRSNRAGNARAAKAATEALRSGAFRIQSVPGLLQKLTKSDEPAARALYSDVTAAFPAKAGPADASFLLDCMNAMAGRDGPTTGEAVRKIVSALAGKSFGVKFSSGKSWRLESPTGQVDMESERDLIAWQLIAFLSAHDPELLESYDDQLSRWRKKMNALGPAGGVKNVLTDATEDDEPAAILDDVTGPSLAMVVEKARSLPIGQRVAWLIEISRRKDVTPSQGSSFAAEALALTPRMKLSENRLMSQAMLTRDAVLRGDDALAASGAKLLSDSFSAFCRCEDSACDSLEGREQCADMIETFAAYLDEHQIAPETLKLYHPSLRARLLLLELERLLS